MRLRYEEIRMIRNIAVEIGINFVFRVKGDLALSEVNKDNTISIIEYPNDDLEFEITPEGECRIHNDKVRKEIEEITGASLNSLHWLRNILLNDIKVKTTNNLEINFPNKINLMKRVFVEYMIKKNCKSMNIFYLNKGLIYNCILYRDCKIVSEYRLIKKDCSKRTNIYVNDLEFLFNLTGSVTFIGVSPNYETPNRKAQFKQLSRLKTEKSYVKVYNS